jgi:CBS domain-containing protein
VLIGLVVLFTDGAVIGGLWPILIGLFLAAAARGSYQQMLTRRALSGRTVGDLMTRNVQTVSPHQTVQSLVDDVMLAHGVGFVPVIEDGRILGYVDTGTVREIDRENWDTTRVEDVFVSMTPEMRTSPGEPLERLVKRIAQTGRRKFIVADGHSFGGVITLSDLVAHVDVLRDLSDAGRAREKPSRPFDAIRRP